MKKVSFRVRNFDKEQFLTYNIDNEADLDEDVLDFLEDEEPSGIVPIIFDDEEEDYDTFSYDITDKIHLTELSNQEINAEMVLMVMRGIAVSLTNMAEYRIPLSYLVLHRNYIYIDSDYRVEFICIPLLEMTEEPDVNGFLRGILASLRYDPSENGDYVARLLTYINTPETFKLHNLITLIEEIMDEFGIEIPEDNETGLYVDYKEIEDDEPETEEIPDRPDVETSEDAQDIINKIKQQVMEEEKASEQMQEDETTDEVIDEPVIDETPETPPEETEIVEDDGETEETEESEEIKDDRKKSNFKTKDPTVTGVVIHDELDDFLAEKEMEEKMTQKEESGIKMKKAVKVSRASIVNSNKEELKEQVVAEDDTGQTKDNEEEEVSSGSILSQTIGATGLLKGTGSVPKANPYLVRVNTDERIMVTKQVFKIGKASMGVDYTVTGNGAVSRVHAILTNKDDVYYIKDNKSTNHTYVNGKILNDGEEALLTHDSKIMLGDEEFIFKLR